MSDPIDLLQRAMTTTGRVVAGVRPEQLTDSTPCTEWTVRELLNHIVGTSRMFGRCAAGDTDSPDAKFSPFAPPGDVLGNDVPATAYDQAQKLALEGWRTPGALDGTVTLPVGESPGQAAIMIQLADNVTHGWDLARATGQTFEPDADVVEAAYAAVNGRMSDSSRGEGKPFAAEVKVPDDASALDKLIGYLGRRP